MAMLEYRFAYQDWTIPSKCKKSSPKIKPKSAVKDHDFTDHWCGMALDIDGSYVPCIASISRSRRASSTRPRRAAPRRVARRAWAVTLGVAALPRSGARAARLFSAGASAIDEIANCRKAAYPFAGPNLVCSSYSSILRLRSKKKKGVSVDFHRKNLPPLFFSVCCPFGEIYS